MENYISSQAAGTCFHHFFLSLLSPLWSSGPGCPNFPPKGLFFTFPVYWRSKAVLLQLDSAEFCLRQAFPLNSFAFEVCPWTLPAVAVPFWGNRSVGSFASDSVHGLRNSFHCSTCSRQKNLILFRINTLSSVMTSFNSSFQALFLWLFYSSALLNILFYIVHNALQFLAAVRGRESRDFFQCGAFTCFPFTAIWNWRTWVFIVLQKSVYGKKEQNSNTVLWFGLEYLSSSHLELTIHLQTYIHFCIITFSWFTCPESCWVTSGAFSWAFVIYPEGLSNTRLYQTNTVTVWYSSW